jgi:hypothetical protein
MYWEKLIILGTMILTAGLCWLAIYIMGGNI